VLEKSADIDKRVSSLSGMKRTRTDQMKRIKELVEQNQQVDKELQEAYALAVKRRDQVRKTLREGTCRALGIQEKD
jgi:DNA-binding ferritin-like protein